MLLTKAFQVQKMIREADHLMPQSAWETVERFGGLQSAQDWISGPDAPYGCYRVFCDPRDVQKVLSEAQLTLLSPSKGCDW